jgi:hypothetical protein
VVKEPSLPDIMGYCDNPWISDYVYQRVMAFRRSNASAVASAALAQPCLLIWGRIVNGQAVLEPAFQVVTRPYLPKSRGPYSLEAKAADGARLFALSFDATPSADDPHGGRHFAFAVPLDPGAAGRVESLRLVGPNTVITATAPAQAQVRTTTATDDISVRRDAGAVTVQWNRSAHPMLLVRDPDTGQILSFARGGSARVATGKSVVDLEVSDGVRSQRVRRAINR